MNCKIVSVLCILCASSVEAQTGIHMNEVMYAPKAPEPEWIELVNYNAVPISLAGWSITVKTKTVVLDSIVLNAGAYLVLTKDSISLRLSHGDHPFTIDQISLPQLANAGDIIVLRDSGSNTIDSIHYLPSWGGASAKSLERISLNKPSYDSTNWGTSIAAQGSTPGLYNSISPLQYDLGIQLISVNVIQSELRVSLSITNNGTLVSGLATLAIYADTNRDGKFDSSEIIDSIILPAIEPAVVLDTTLQITLVPGAVNYEAAIHYPQDENALNDTVTFTAQSARGYPSLVAINEVMYAPTSPEPEWIELYNKSSDSMDLSLSTIRTHSGEHGVIPAGSAIAPHGFLILTKNDTALLAARPLQAQTAHIVQMPLPDLANAGSTIALLDARDSLIDSLVYLPSWGGAKGKSLERIDYNLPALDSTNLGQCIDPSGATLGLPNSISKQPTDAALISVQDSTNADGTIELIGLIENRGRTIIDSVLVEVVDSGSSGIPIASETLVTQLTPRATEECRFSVSPSQYGVNKWIVSILAPNDTTYIDDTLISIDTIPVPAHGLAINEVMLSPLSTSCQWIELFNTTTLPIETSSLWLLTTSAATHHFQHIPEAVIPSSSFALLAADSTLYNAFPALETKPGVILFGKTTLDMTVTYGGIAILNVDSTIIDTFCYASDWLPKAAAGTSLERISRDRSALDSTNWLQCLATSGGTPLAENSVSGSPTGVGASSISASPNPFSPDGDGIADNTSISFSTASTGEVTVRLRVFDMRNRIVRTLLNGAHVFRTSEVNFDGKSDTGKTLGVGIYTMLLEATDAGGITQTSKSAVVIAKRVR